MKHYSENQIKLLHQEFKLLKRYIDKLFFFDLHFGIIPFPFPSFDPALLFFFEDNKTEALTEIFKKERNNPMLTEKLFPFKAEYRFNIKPANSNCSVYSTYILSKFLSLSPAFDEFIQKRGSQSGYTSSSVKQLLDEANRIINSIEYKLQNEYDKSLKLHCMTVFYKGLYDAYINRVNLPDKKRKFTELYLYAQGILYAKYLEALKNQYAGQQTGKAVAKPHPFFKIGLLKEFGVIDLFKKKYAIPDSESFEEKLSKILCPVNGESL
jgi:hypothetical protein